MSIMAIIGLVLLIIIIIVGTIIKIYTKRTLKDMDGVGNATVLSEDELDNVVIKADDEK